MSSGKSLPGRSGCSSPTGCDPDEAFADTVGKVAEFSLHAGVAAKADERKKLERLWGYFGTLVESPVSLDYAPGLLRLHFRAETSTANAKSLRPEIETKRSTPCPDRST